MSNKGIGMAQQRRVVSFSGDVQGVGFRAMAMRAAGGFKVTGYVRNVAGGRVEVLAEGEGQEIDAFLEAVRERMGMYIADEATTTHPATGQFHSFNIRF